MLRGDRARALAELESAAEAKATALELGARNPERRLATLVTGFSD
jgi:hypothetical protein